MEKENIFKKFSEIIKKIFRKKTAVKYITAGNSEKENGKRKLFVNNLQEFNNTEKLIEKVSQDINILYNMSLTELKELNKAIHEKQEILNQNITKLKVQIAHFN